MRHMLSRDNLYDFAHQAVGAVRRIVSSSEAWGAREALSSVSQAVAVACKTNTPVEVTTLTAWAGDLVRELETYYSTPGSPVGTGAADAAAIAAAVTGSNGAAKDEAAKPLSESALAANLEVARALVFTCNAEAAITAYRSNKLVAALVQFYCSAALTQKLRDCGANVVVGVCSSHALLVREFMIMCRDRLRGAPPNEHNSRVLQILLASLAVEVLHQFQLRSYGHLQTELDIETAENCTSLMDSLFDVAYTLTVHGKDCATANGSGGIAAATPHAASRTPSTDADAAPSSRPPTPPPAAEPPNPSSAAASPASPLPATVSARIEGDGAAAAGGSQGSVNLDVTTAVVFLAVTAGVYRARPALKRYLVRHSGAEYAQVWVRAASQVSQMRTTLFLRQSSRSPVSATLEPVEYWRGELLEGLVELCTMDSFTVQRAMVMSAAAAAGQGAMPAAQVSAAAAGGAARKGVSGAATAASAAGSPLQLPPSGSSAGAAAAAAARQLFEPVPADWETYLSSSSPAVWRLAAALFPCIITADGVEIFKAVLLLLNTRHLSAEALYRCTISTLTLLCAANPRNAVVLSEHDILHTIIALVNCNQASVFPASQQVTLWSQRHGILNPMLDGATAGPGMPLEQTLTLTPPSTLNVNTTQLTFGFLHALTSIYFSKATVHLLRQGVRDMYATASAQTDVDVIESLLYGLGRAFIPHPLLFFPGDGYVSWRLKQMFPRGSGYTFTAWIFPTCVWVGGSCLYTFMDQYDTRVSVLIVADGRQCSLVVRVSKAGGEPAEVLLGGSSFTASTWTHLVINHGVAMNVYVNGQRLEPVHEVPYPKEKHSLLFSIGGAAQLPGFFGFVSGMNISATLSEKEIAKLHAAGPGFYDPARDCASFLKPFFEDETVSTPGNGSGAGASSVSGGGGGAGTPSDPLTPSASGSPLHHNDMIAKRSAEFHWHHLELYTPTDIEELIAPSRVAEWVLETLKLRRTAAVQSVSTFMNVAKLSTSFFSTAMQLSTTEQLTHLMRKSYLDRLRTEVLSWKTTFPEFASLLLQAVTPRGGGKVLHRHPCTQRVFDILMSCVLRSGAPLGSEGMIAQTFTATFVSVPSGVTATRHPSSSASGLTSPTSSPRGDSTTEANATNIILRELSDCLVVSENRDMFQEDPERFQSILNVSLHLPKECIKSVVILIEKLCRSEAELRRVLLFLFTPSSVSPTADTAKVRVLRMLFDIAQEDDAMCEMVQECFKGRGITLMLLLVNGERHSSEAIRVLALGLLSLLMPLRSCTKFFKKNDGFDMLSLALTEPRSSIPLGIRTFDALFQIAFDEFRRHREKKPEPDSIAARLMASAPFIHRQKQRDTPSSSSAAAAASSALASGAASHLAQLRVQRRVDDFLGHTPSITASQLGTRRGYSFEHTHDYGRVSEDFGELVLLHKGSRYHSLHLPLALKTVLCALDFLIRVLVHRLSVSPAPLAITSALQGGGGASTFSAGTPAEHRTPSGEFPASPSQRQESGLVSSYTRAAPLDGEHVVVEVLNYLDKVIEWPKHALKVMDIQWLAGLWAAVRVFFERPAELSGTLSASPVQAHEPAPMPPSAAAAWGAGALQPSEAAVRRLHQERGDFVADVTQRSRTVIRKMVILDISVNERAQIRAIRDGEHPPRLVRIVLEEVARHFAVQKNGELLENAGNIIRNLNSLFKDVHAALHPFPPTLGLAIVLAITNISVSSSMQVRRRMKNSSNLLTIRDNLAFYVLRESRRFLRLRKRSLNQLIDLNLGNTHAATVLLLHLSNSIKENNVNEVELLVTLVRQMTASDSVRMRELHALMGDSKNVRPLRELLTGSGNTAGSGSVSSGRSPLLPAAYNSHPSPSDRTMSEVLTDVDSNAGGTPWGVSHAGGANPLEEDGPELSPGAYTVQLLDWCRLNRETWAGVQRAVAAALASAGLDKRDEKGHHQAQLQLQQQQQPLTACGSPKAASGSSASVGLSDRSRREFQQLRDEFESELAKSALDAK